MLRKVIFYLKQNKSIVITDDSESTDEELSQGISNSMESNKVAYFETKDDIVLINPTELSAVLIQRNCEKENIFPEEPLDEDTLFIPKRKKKKFSRKNELLEKESIDALNKMVESLKNEENSEIIITESTIDEENEKEIDLGYLECVRDEIQLECAPDEIQLETLKMLEETGEEINDLDVSEPIINIID